VILLIQDTTDLIHTVTKGLKGIGTLKEIEKSFFASNDCYDTVFAKEENPSAGEKPIEWLLLTSMKIDTFEQAAY